MNQTLYELSIEFPNLPCELLVFFKGESEHNSLKKKTLIEFLTQESKDKDRIINPSFASQVCDVLVKHGYLTLIEQNGPMGTLNQYVTTSLGIASNLKLSEEQFNEHIRCLVYGFPYIFENYKECVVPICFKNVNGDKSLGTGFCYRNCIITARHCLEKSAEISILGFSKEKLSLAKVLYHSDTKLDLALIKLDGVDNFKSFIHADEAKVLDSVIAIGYPIVPGFHTFVAVEEAQVSARLTITKGNIAAKAEDIFSQKDLLLITAKIRGGNSGGPLVNSLGFVVGVTVQQPLGEGKYDDLGYGTAIPMKYVDFDMLEKGLVTDMTKEIKFVEFE